MEGCGWGFQSMSINIVQSICTILDRLICCFGYDERQVLFWRTYQDTPMLNAEVQCKRCKFCQIWYSVSNIKYLLNIYINIKYYSWYFDVPLGGHTYSHLECQWDSSLFIKVFFSPLHIFHMQTYSLFTFMFNFARIFCVLA